MLHVTRVNLVQLEACMTPLRRHAIGSHPTGSGYLFINNATLPPEHDVTTMII